MNRFVWDKTCCAAHKDCGNENCLHKPTEDEWSQIIMHQITIKFADFHQPIGGIKCQYHQRIEYNAAIKPL